MRDVNPETITGTLSWYKTWQLNGFHLIRAKKKTSQETKKISQKVLEPTKKPQSFSTNNSLKFGKACEDLSWNHCTSTPHRSDTNGIAERAVRSVKERRLRYCSNQVWMKNGGRVTWNVTAICEIFRIFI